MKAGRSDAGARAASSHTGARATSEALVDMMLRESGVIRTRTLEELFDVATVLANQPVPGGRRVAIVTNAGGPAILAADACERTDSRCRARRGIQRGSHVPAADGQRGESGRHDCVGDASSMPALQRWPPIRRSTAFRDLLPPLVTVPTPWRPRSRRGVGDLKPLVASFLGSRASAAARAGAAVRVSGSRGPPWRTSRYDSGAASYRRRRSDAGEIRVRVRGLIQEVCAKGEGWLAPSECDAILKAAGVPVLASRMARTADEAVAAARDIGLPAVLKAVGQRILHKSDVGGVRLALASEQAVRDAFHALAGTLGDAMDAVLVQPMVTGGVEMAVGGLNDPAFGPVVMCGTGGVLIDLLDDTAFAMCPLTECGATQLVERIKGRVRLRGFRGAPAGDEHALRRLIVRASQLLHACPEIREMDLNPVMVLPAGAIVADVRMLVGTTRPPATGRRIRH